MGARDGRAGILPVTTARACNGCSGANGYRSIRATHRRTCNPMAASPRRCLASRDAPRPDLLHLQAVNRTGAKPARSGAVTARAAGPWAPASTKPGVCGWLLLVITSSTAVPVAAADDPPWWSTLKADSKFGALATFTTNYFYRGYSKSDNRPTLRGNLDYEHDSGIFGGAWLSWIDFGDGAYPGHSDLEFYPYLGYTHKLSEDFRAELTVARYIFNDRVFGRYSDYNDYGLAIHYRDVASARVYYADDAYHRDAPFTTAELSGRYPFTESLEFSAGAGYNVAREVLEYDSAYWHAGVTWYWTRLAFDFRYIDSHYTSSVATPSSIDHQHEFELLLPDPKFMFSLTAGY